MAVERLGERVATVPGSTAQPQDHDAGRPGLGRERPARRGRGHGMSYRVGSGFDAHRLAEGRPLMLGGVQVPHARGLEGHSDGDCLIHAVCDAMLGAAGAGDMGTHFPSSDDRLQWRARDRLPERGASASCPIASRSRTSTRPSSPRRRALLPHLEAMRESLARALGLGARARLRQGQEQRRPRRAGSRRGHRRAGGGARCGSCGSHRERAMNFICGINPVLEALQRGHAPLRPPDRGQGTAQPARVGGDRAREPPRACRCASRAARRSTASPAACRTRA